MQDIPKRLGHLNISKNISFTKKYFRVVGTYLIFIFVLKIHYLYKNENKRNNLQ